MLSLLHLVIRHTAGNMEVALAQAIGAGDIVSVIQLLDQGADANGVVTLPGSAAMSPLQRALCDRRGVASALSWAVRAYDAVRADDATNFSTLFTPPA